MDTQQIREQFPVTRNHNFLNHAGVAPLSRPACEAMHHYARQACEDAGIGSEFYRHAEDVRRLAAQLIHAGSEEVTFVKNTTEGIGWVANGLNWNTGDNVVTANVEFPANIYPWMALQSRGVRMKMIPEDNGRVPLERIAEAIDSHTRVVTISAIQYASGFRTDLAALGRICKEKGVLFCVDAIQALGAFPIDVKAMNIDFLSADGHKWLCGPEGCGIFYCNRSLIGHLHPVMAGWFCMRDALDFGNYRFEFVDTARKFDTGSYNLAGIYGLGASLQLLLEVGIQQISSHVLALTDRLAQGVQDKGYRVVSSRREGEASGIVAFTSGLHDHEGIRKHLQDEYRIIIAVREGRLRASPHLYNTKQEIDQIVELLPAH